MVVGDRSGDGAGERRVLVVDDDPDIRRIFESALTDGWHVTTAADGDEAKSFLEKTPIACLVADHMMPGMTGIDLCREAAALQPHAGRVLVTASERMRDLTDAINVGRVHRFLPKPVRIADLVAVVTDAVRVCDIERQNAILVAELRDKNRQLQSALHAVQESEKRLEREVQERTQKLREANAELEKLALRDGLTGLYNHRFFQEALNTELARAARYGNSVERIREMVAEHPFAHREKQPPGFVSVSAGVAAFPAQAADKVSLIQAADDAMLSAKRTGRNRVVAAAPKA